MYWLSTSVLKQNKFLLFPDFPECKLGEFRCQNDVCIDENKHCDGKIDCDDESDEIGCGNYLD